MQGVGAYVRQLRGRSEESVFRSRDGTFDVGICIAVGIDIAAVALLRSAWHILIAQLLGGFMLFQRGTQVLIFWVGIRVVLFTVRTPSLVWVCMDGNDSVLDVSQHCPEIWHHFLSPLGTNMPKIHLEGNLEWASLNLAGLLELGGWRMGVFRYSTVLQKELK